MIFACVLIRKYWPSLVGINNYYKNVKINTQLIIFSVPTVNFKNINASSFDVTLEWESPENNECVDEYIIYLDNEEKQRLTDTFTTNITDLHACQKYTVGIAVFYAGTEGTKTEKPFDTPVPECKFKIKI